MSRRPCLCTTSATVSSKIEHSLRQSDEQLRLKMRQSSGFAVLRKTETRH